MRESNQCEQSQTQLLTATVVASPHCARSARLRWTSSPQEACRDTTRDPTASQPNSARGPTGPSMGQLFSSLWGSLFGGGRELKIVMVGLDNAGKTTVLYRMSLGQTIETTATVGSNVEQIRHGNLTFEVCLALHLHCLPPACTHRRL